MELIGRLILVLTIAVQPLAVVVRPRCLPGQMPPSGADLACGCCEPAMMPLEALCGDGSEGVAACCCERPNTEPAQPPAPQARPGGETLHLALPSAAPGISLASAATITRPQVQASSAARHSGRSIQSILCTWLT
jgi:hypothetical protein